jgi:hypothetical protein
MKDPVITKAIQDIKSDLEKSATILRELREEVRVRIHLGGLEVKDEWRRLEPRLEQTLERAAKEVTDASHKTITEVTDAVRRLRQTLR